MSHDNDSCYRRECIFLNFFSVGKYRFCRTKSLYVFIQKFLSVIYFWFLCLASYLSTKLISYLLNCCKQKTLVIRGSNSHISATSHCLTFILQISMLILSDKWFSIYIFSVLKIYPKADTCTFISHILMIVFLQELSN